MYEVIDEDPGYDVEADIVSTENDRPKDNFKSRLNRSLFPEYTAWIVDEGRMEKQLRLMHAGPHDDEADDDIDTSYPSN